jgi:hypothetical protein
MTIKDKLLSVRFWRQRMVGDYDNEERVTRAEIASLFSEELYKRRAALRQEQSGH